MTTQVLEINPDLEIEVMTSKTPTKTLACRSCGRGCVVTMFASPLKTECTACRRGQAPAVGPEPSATDEHDTAIASEVPTIDPTLEPEVLTDKELTKTVPCRKCRRACVVTTFATASKVECLTCRGKNKAEHKEKVQTQQAQTVNPAKLEHLVDGIVNPVFKTIPLCPFDQEHLMELKAVMHSPAYGPRRLLGYDKGMPRYHQETGEVVTYQCLTCHTVISYSTQVQVNMLRQNETKSIQRDGPPFLVTWLGTHDTEEVA